MAKVKYAKIVNGTVCYHGNEYPIVNDDSSITVTNNAETLREHGFKPVVENDAEPPEGFIAQGFQWAENDTQIYKEWIYSEKPTYDEPTLEERLSAVELMLLEMLGVEV